MDNSDAKNEKPKSSKEIKAQAREERLRAQLKANLSRRKAQGRARGTGKVAEQNKG